jgi:[ribosomal protein S18]-alanine N-acetyltransferase
MTGELREINIRHFSIADLSRVMEIEPASFMMVDAWSKPIFRKWYRKCTDLFIVAEISGTIVGYMCTSIEQKTGEIESIAVDPAFRRQGVASALMDYTFREMHTSGITTVELQVRTTNTGAIRFWQKLGFSPSGILPNFYDDGAEALQMKKSLR